MSLLIFCAAVGDSATPGYWQGIRFRTDDPNNSLDHVEIAHGGANNWANIYLDGNSQATVTNSTLRRSATYGIVVEEGGCLDASGNTYENNAEGEIRNGNN